MPKTVTCPICGTVQRMQDRQIITSPFIKNVSISNVVVSPKSSKDAV